MSKLIKFFLLIIVTIVVYLVVAMLFTGWFTKHGESIKVPDINGMPIEKAITLLENNGLELQVNDSVYKEDFKAMAIVEQNPAAGMNVKPGRTIYVIINTGKIPKVKMPQLVNGSSNLALVLLKNAGLKIGKIDSIKSILGAGLVLKQRYNGNDIPTHTLLDKGSIIDIVVSKTMSMADTNALKNLNTSGFEEVETAP